MGEAWLRRVKRKSEGNSVAQKGAAKLKRGSLAQRVQRSSDRVQHSSEECSVA
jgi:hypothetical protein